MEAYYITIDGQPYCDYQYQDQNNVLAELLAKKWPLFLCHYVRKCDADIIASLLKTLDCLKDKKIEVVPGYCPVLLQTA